MNKYQKGFAPIIIALIVLVLAGAGGTGYYLISKQVKLSNNQNLQNNNIDISDWKIYTNSDADFEIKYPSSWESPFGNWGPGFTAGTSIDNNNLCVIDAMGWSGSNDAEIADLIGKGYVKTSIKIDGIDGIRLTRNPAGAGLTEAVYFEANGKSFRIGRNRGTNDKIEQDCIKNFNQIINNFKLTNEEVKGDETADWKIYKNEQLGIEVRYPSIGWEMKSESKKSVSFGDIPSDPMATASFIITVDERTLDQYMLYINENSMCKLNSSSESIKKIEDLTIGDLSANRLIYCDEFYGVNSYKIFIRNNNKSYIIDYRFNNPIHQQMLSTIRFI
jgi:hypothetical protein